MSRSRKNIAFRVLLFTAILLPTAAITTVSLFFLKDALTAREAARRQTIVERDKLFAHAVAHGIAVYVEAAKDAVAVAAAQASDKPLTKEAMRPLITDMVDNTSAFFASSVGDASGKAVLVYDPKGKTEAEKYSAGLDLSGRDYYKELLATRRPVVSNAITSLVSPQPTIAVAAPILDAEGNVRGFVAAGVSLAPLYQLALAELGDEPAVPVAIDKLGQVILHPDQQLIDAHVRLDGLEPAKRVLRGEEGYLDAFIDTDGVARSAAYAPVPGLGWGVWIAQAASMGGAQFVQSELERTALFYGLILLLNVVLAFIILRLLRQIGAMRRKERTYLESVGDGVIAIDRYWNITLWNPATARLTGWSEQEALGKPFRERVHFIREHDRKENLAFIEEAMLYGETKMMSNSTLLLTRDGREVPVGDSAAPIFDEKGQVTGVIIVFRDASREKEASLLRTDFAYASHQLRTPINKALWSLESVVDAVKDADIKEQLTVALRGVMDVQKLAERLLMVSQIDQHRMLPEFKEIDLGAFLKDVFDEAEKVADKRGVKLETPSVPRGTKMDADPKLYKEALLELLQNAVMYSQPGGKVEVEMHLEPLECVLQVRDQGIGISDEQKPLIFTKFFRGQNVPSDAAGAGLGLFIAREYARLMGGKLWFESELGKCSTFTISLPRLRGMTQ